MLVSYNKVVVQLVCCIWYTIRTPVGFKIKGVNYNAYIEKGTTEVFHLLGNLIV
jgi:hypothetical protein